MIRAMAATVVAHRLLVARPAARRPCDETAPPTHERIDPVSTCEELARALRAGHSPLAAIDEASGLDLPEAPTLIERIERALAATDDSDQRLLLSVLATVAHSGGAGAETLDRCALRLRTRAEERREQRLASAPARLSALVLTIVPVGVLALLAATSAGVRDHLVSSVGAFGLVVGLMLNVAGWRWMRRTITRSVGGGQMAMLTELADVLESTTLSVRAGITPRVAVLGSALHAGERLAPHLTEFGWRLEHGWLTADALAGLGDRIGPTGRRLIDGLVRAERYGSPLAPVLDRMVDDIDSLRREIATKRNRTLPVRLAPPLVLCTLPSFALLAIVPAVGAALAGLGSGPLGDI
jgi:Flp pilus assembly protein TadB